MTKILAGTIMVIDNEEKSSVHAGIPNMELLIFDGAIMVIRRITSWDDENAPICWSPGIIEQASGRW